MNVTCGTFPCDLTIIVIESDGQENIRVFSENPESDGVIITLELLTQENNTFYSYNISVTP